MRKTLWIFTATLSGLLCSCKSEPDAVSGNPSSGPEETQPKTEETKVPSEIKYDTYCNERFGYCIDYPLGVLFPQGESGNKDGQVFESRNSENTLTVYRDFRDMIDETPDHLKNAFEEDTKSENGKSVTYQKLGKDHYVVSGYDHGKIFYQKSILSDGELSTCILAYNQQDRALYDKISERIFRSFK